jgi:hypothetical protein
LIGFGHDHPQLKLRLFSVATSWLKTGIFKFDTTSRRLHFLRHGFYLIPLAAHRAADLLERFHDVRVVWPFEVQEQAAAARHPRELGHRVF